MHDNQTCPLSLVSVKLYVIVNWECLGLSVGQVAVTEPGTNDSVQRHLAESQTHRLAAEEPRGAAPARQWQRTMSIFRYPGEKNDFVKKKKNVCHVSGDHC